MNRKIIIMLILISLIFSLFAQNESSDLPSLQKSARRAFLLSSLFPGAGQFYANKSSLTLYLFPILEIGLWTGYLYYHNQGLDKEDSYENFADQWYDRTRQHLAEEDLIDNCPTPGYGFYTEHFRLDDDNSQHFYEDIGKYSKYIFGWEDWFDIFATDGNGNFASPDWIWEESQTTAGSQIMVGVNDPNNPNSAYYLGNESLYSSANGLYSSYRAEYIQMRKDAENSYEKGRYFSYGIMLNHAISALDAVRLVRRHNQKYLPKFSFNLSPRLVNNSLSPSFTVTARF
jgi:hypothetical protein